MERVNPFFAILQQILMGFQLFPRPEGQFVL